MNPSQPIQVLLVDDEEIIRYGIKMILQSEPTITVVGEAENGEDAIALAQTLKPHVILMDLNMPGIDGVTAIGEIGRCVPTAKSLVLTTVNQSQKLIDAMAQGAVGYLLKNTPPSDFIQIIQSTYKGYLQFSPDLGQNIRSQLQAQTTPSESTSSPDIKAHVSPREQDVLNLVAQGANNREIAQKLHIAEKTVKNHVSNILSRVGLRDRTQLAIWANNLGS